MLHERLVTLVAILTEKPLSRYKLTFALGR